MNLFKELVITAPVSNRLQFGYNDNVIISNIDTEVRKIKGLPIKANTFITLTQVDPDTRKSIAQNEFNFFNLDSTSDFVEANFVEQLTALASILDAVGADVTAYEAAILEVLGSKELEVMLRTKDGAKALQEALQNSFAELMNDFIGDNCPLLKCKLIVNKKGYLEISKVQSWILPMSSDEPLPEIDPRELKIRAEALSGASTPTVVKPDTLGEAKPAPSVAAPEKQIAGAGFVGL